VVLVAITVLIVDDSKLARMSVARALNALHPEWKRIEAGNADEAVTQVREHSPQIALVDFNMPGKDGLTLATELRELDPGLSIAVISANRQAEVINRTRGVGAFFLAKPLTEQDLKEFLALALKKREGTAK
jgi:DNA-binding NarL/FixJ family response regulator